MASVGLSMISPFLPLFLRELGVAGSEEIKIWSGIVFAAPFAVSAFMQPLWGIMGDRRGRKPMVVRAMLGLALAHALMGFSQSASQLLILRLLQGSLAGFIAPSLALLASCTPPEKTGSALGTLQSALVSGTIVGPLIGGLLAHIIGSRPIFFWTGFFCLAGAVIVIRFVKEDFVPSEKENKSYLMTNIRSVFLSKELRTLFLLLVIVQFSVFFVAPFLALYVEFLKVSKDYVELATGLAFGITGITSAIAAPILGSRGDKIGHRGILRISLAGIIVFILPQAFVTNVYQLLFLRAGLGIFVAGTAPSINTIVHRSTSAQDRGGIYGIFQSGYLIGNMAGPLLGGLMAAYFGLRSIFLITSLILCFGVILARKIK